MTQKCPASKISNNYFSRRSHILMSLRAASLPTLITHWSGGSHISLLSLRIGPIVFCFGSIECFYSVILQGGPLIIATFFVSFYLVVNFWFVCNYIRGTVIIFRIVSTSSSRQIFYYGARWQCELGQGCSEWVFSMIPSHYYGDYNLLLSKSWELVITVIQSAISHHQQHRIKWSCLL